MNQTTLLDEDTGSCCAMDRTGYNVDHNHPDVLATLTLVGRLIVDKVPPRDAVVPHVDRTCTDLDLDLALDRTSHSWAFVVLVVVVDVEEDTALGVLAYVTVRLKVRVVLDHRVLVVRRDQLGSTAQVGVLAACLTEAMRTKVKALVGTVIAPSAMGACNLLNHVVHLVRLA